MYLRWTQRKRKDGSSVGYVQLAHNRRVDGVTQAEVLVNLGREDLLDLDGLRRLTRSISRYPGGPADVGEVRVRGCRSWRRGRWAGPGCSMGCGAGSGSPRRASRVGERRFGTDVERVLFALVANRAMQPFSKLAAAEWASNDVHIPGLEAMDEDQAYRAMDVLAAADTEAKVQESVFFACADL